MKRRVEAVSPVGSEEVLVEYKEIAEAGTWPGLKKSKIWWKGG